MIKAAVVALLTCLMCCTIVTAQKSRKSKRQKPQAQKTQPFDEDYFTAFELTEKWELVGDTSDANFYFKKDTLKKLSNSEIVECWILQVIKLPADKHKNADMATWFSSKMRFQFNCEGKRRTTRTLDKIDYDRRGKVLSLNSDDFADWDVIVPESIGERLYSRICIEEFLSRPK